jgi:membrane-associated phospholipid phosphatase
VLQPPAFTNQYAAVPSLHVGWDLLAGIAIATTARRRWVRALGAVLPVLMVLAVIVTANHYVLDAVAGALLAVASLAAVRHRARRRAASAARASNGLPAAPPQVLARPRPAEVSKDRAVAA